MRKIICVGIVVLFLLVASSFAGDVVSVREGDLIWIKETRKWGKIKIENGVLTISDTAAPGEKFPEEKKPVAPPVSEKKEPPPTSDPYGFVSWLNTVRAAAALAPVAYDPNMSALAHVNNTYQAMYGMGHHVIAPARRQNAGMGEYSTILNGWMGSPGHYDALLDPTIRWVGIASLGSYWTFNAW